MDFSAANINSMFAKMPIFALVVFRMGALFFVAPVFSHKSIPAKIKIAFAFFLALIIFPTIQMMPIELPNNVLSFGLIVLREIAVGAIIGFFVSLLFLVFSLAGTIAGRQVAMEMATTLSPNTETGGSITGHLYYLVGTVLFLSLNGHHWLVKTLAFSYKAIPLSGYRFTPKITEKMIASFSTYFALGVKMAAPFIIVALISLVIVGVILKVTEQHGLFVLELPLKSLVGFFIFIVSAPFIIDFMIGIMEPMKGEVVNLLRYMR